MVLVATSRYLDMREVLNHPLGPLPWALSNRDGTLKKQTNSLLHDILNPSTKSMPLPSACIVDGISLVNETSGEHRTFRDIAESIFVVSRHSRNAINSIYIVFDV